MASTQQDASLVQHALAMGYPPDYVYSVDNFELSRIIAHAQAEHQQQQQVQAANAEVHEDGNSVFDSMAQEDGLDLHQLAATQVLLDQAPPRPVMPREGGMKPLNVQELLSQDTGLEQLGEIVGTEESRGNQLLAMLKQFALNTQNPETMKCYCAEERRDIASYVQSQMLHIEALHEWLTSVREQLQKIITVREQGHFHMEHPRAQKMAARLRSMKTLDVALEQMIAKFSAHRT